MLFAGPEAVKAPLDLVRLWNHECNRVYRDKFLDDKDMDLFDKLQADFNKKLFDVSALIFLVIAFRVLF